MKPAFVIAIGAAVCAACTGSGSTQTPCAPIEKHAGTNPDVREPQAPGVVKPAFEVDIVADPRRELARVRVVAHGTASANWVLPTAGKAQVVEATDAKGKIEYKVGAGSSNELGFLRAPEPPLTFTVEITPSSVEAASSRCPFVVTPDKAIFCGDAVMPIPAQEPSARHDIVVRVVGDRDYLPNTASSLGLESETRAELSFSELAQGAYLFGRLGHARLEVQEGRDHAAWLGFFPFDPRWVAAESAAARTAADRYFKIARPATDPSIGLFLINFPKDGEPTAISPVFRGALIRTDLSSSWTARARIDLARLFVQRTIGSAIRLEPEAEAPFFEDGFAHAMALDLLYELGTVTRDEAAAEISSWLAEDRLSDLSGRSLVELGKLASTENPNANERRSAWRLLAVRGALAALALNDPASERLKGFAGRLIAANKKTILRAELFELAREKNERAAEIQSALESGAALPVRATDLDACVKLADRKIYRFDLGFEVTKESAQAGSDSPTIRVVSVKASSPAAKAGLKPDDVLERMTYSSGNADVPVQLTVKREPKPLDVSFLPRTGAAKQTKALVVSSRTGACAL